MKHLTEQSLDLLVALNRVARTFRMGQREELTIAAVELNQLLGGNARAPYRNVGACTEAIAWCKENDYPLLPLLIVIDANYRHPESTLLNAAFGVQSRESGKKLWEAELNTVATCDLSAFSQMAAKLDEEAHVLKAPKKPSTRTGASQAAGSAGARAKSARSQSREGARTQNAPRQGASAKQPAARKAQRSSAQVQTRVHVQQIDEERFSYVLDDFLDAIKRETGEDAVSLGTYCALVAEPYDRAWNRWADELAIDSWNEGMAGKGAIVASLQKTVDDPDAFWIESDNSVSIARKLRRGLGREDGTQAFELAVIRFFAGTLAVQDFLEIMKEHLARQYSLVSHLLFLKDKDTYVPVASAPLERGLQELGVNFSLSGNCTWVNYERFLSYLDRISALCAKQGIALSRAQAAFFLYFAGTGTLEIERR